jgi:integral membrane sensor domain MASE1
MLQVRPLPFWLKPWVMALAVAALYVATARLGLMLAMPPEKKATAVWPPSGIALAAVLLAGYRVWPGIWLGAFLANMWDYFDPADAFPLRGHFAVSSAIATGSALQALLGGFLLHRWIGSYNPLDRARSAFQFVGIVPLMCLVAPTVGVTTLVLAGFSRWVDYAFNWWTWWLGDTVGILVVTPLILRWSKSPRFAWERWRLAEAVLLLGLLLSVGLFVFGGWSFWGVVTGALAYMTVPLLVWATFRFGQRGATVSLLLLANIAVWGTVHQHGPFVQKTLNESLLLLQTFIGVLAVTALALAGVLAERRQAEQAKAAAIEQLEQALHEIKTLRGLIPICAWCKKIRNDGGSWEQLEGYLREHTEAEFSHGICPECFAKRSDDTYPAG